MGWMGWDRRLGFGGNVRWGWINGLRMLVGVCVPLFLSDGLLTVASAFLARTLRTGFPRLQSMVREAVVGSTEDVKEGYVGPEVVLMLQSIASVQQSR